MNDADLDRILDGDASIEPSATFTPRVMAAVKVEASERHTGLSDSISSSAWLSSPWLGVLAGLTAVAMTLPFLPTALAGIPDEATRPLIMTVIGTALVARWSMRWAAR